MGCNTKNKEKIMHQEGESIFTPVPWIPNKGRSKPVNVLFVIWT
jgi:hypothetical protein